MNRQCFGWAVSAPRRSTRSSPSSARTGAITDASKAEQQSFGLDRLSEQEFARSEHFSVAQLVAKFREERESDRWQVYGSDPPPCAGARADNEQKTELLAAGTVEVTRPIISTRSAVGAPPM
jgi:hypothetical protein